MKSLSEIETTSKRATRAAGFSWGVSEEVGKCIRLLELFGLPGIKNLNSYFNHLKFSVPIVIKTSPYLNLVRPNPGKNEMLIFSSYMIHGGGINDNQDTTRVSIELRFWRSN